MNHPSDESDAGIIDDDASSAGHENASNDDVMTEDDDSQTDTDMYYIIEKPAVTEDFDACACYSPFDDDDTSASLAVSTQDPVVVTQPHTCMSLSS